MAPPLGDVQGPFTSLFDFCTRVDRSRLNKRTVEALIKAGAFDSCSSTGPACWPVVDLAFDLVLLPVANANQQPV
jgi:DNA polymerase-3 subunit alpha